MQASRHLTSGFEMLCKITLEIEGVEDCHNIRTRGTADNVFMDLHVHVREDMHMDEAHCIAYIVEKRIKERVELVYPEPDNRISLY